MHTPARTQTPILRYGVHRSITSRNPRIGYLTNVSQLKFLDPPGISSRAQFIYLHIVVPLRHPARYLCPCPRPEYIHGLKSPWSWGLHPHVSFFFTFSLGLF
jgi:hypothetical protein